MRSTLHLLASVLLVVATGCTWSGQHEYFEFAPPAAPGGSWLIGSNDQGYVGSQTGDFRTRR
jgi:hypothetical protein